MWTCIWKSNTVNFLKKGVERMPNRFELPDAPDLKVCKTIKETIIQQHEFTRACFSIFAQEFNNNRERDIKQDERINGIHKEIKGNTKFRHRALGALLILSIIISCGLTLLSSRVRHLIGL